MIRKIIHIDEEKCNGCGLCAEACHEGAIDIVDGKAKLMRENFCDGFGDCLPGCPTGAITFEEREAPEYDESAVKAAKGAARPVDRSGTEKEDDERNESRSPRGRMPWIKNDAVYSERSGKCSCECEQAGFPTGSVALPDQTGSDTGSFL